MTDITHITDRERAQAALIEQLAAGRDALAARVEALEAELARLREQEPAAWRRKHVIDSVVTCSYTDKPKAVAAWAERGVTLEPLYLAAPPAQPIETLPLDYLRGFRDGLEWAADLAEAEDPRTSDWMYDDRNDLAEAIRRGPEMPPAQPAQAQPARLSDERIDEIASAMFYADEPMDSMARAFRPQWLESIARPLAHAIAAAVVPQGFVVVKDEPVAWEVYNPEANNGYLVDSLDDMQLVEDMTNCEGVEATPLYAKATK